MYERCANCGKYSKHLNQDNLCKTCYMNLIESSEIELDDNGWVQNEEFSGFQKCSDCGKYQYKTIMNDGVCEPCYLKREKLLAKAYKETQAQMKEAAKVKAMNEKDRLLQQQKQINDQAPLILPPKSLGKWWF